MTRRRAQGSAGGGRRLASRRRDVLSVAHLYFGYSTTWTGRRCRRYKDISLLKWRIRNTQALLLLLTIVLATAIHQHTFWIYYQLHPPLLFSLCTKVLPSAIPSRWNLSWHLWFFCCFIEPEGSDRGQWSCNLWQLCFCSVQHPLYSPFIRLLVSLFLFLNQTSFGSPLTFLYLHVTMFSALYVFVLFQKVEVWCKQFSNIVFFQAVAL